jgi:hypothetical protein
LILGDQRTVFTTTQITVQKALNAPNTTITTYKRRSSITDSGNVVDIIETRKEQLPSMISSSV